MESQEKIKKLNEWMKKLKIFQPSPSIYDSISGFQELGPYGMGVKNNVVNAMRKGFKSEAYWEVETPIIMPKRVWEASGHLSKFVDLVAESDSKIYRVDKVLEEEYPELARQHQGKEALAKLLGSEKIIPKGRKEPLHNPRDYNLMVMASVNDQDVVLRPETATTTYLSFKDYHTLFRGRMPLKLFQFGKAFRNEVTCRQGLIRGREFEQFEGQMFLLEEDKMAYDLGDASELEGVFWSSKDQVSGKDPKRSNLSELVSDGTLRNPAYAACFATAWNVLQRLGLEGSVRFRQHLPDEKAHYALDAWDVELNSDQYGWLEICGIHDRGDYDLKRHAEFSGKSLTVKSSTGNNEIPHILEIAFGVGRSLYGVMENSYSERNGKTVLNFPRQLAPIDAAVFPLVKKDGLPDVAKRIHKNLLGNDYTSVYDEKGSIGKRYARMDEIGTPRCITVDYDTIDNNTVTVRYRDTGEQQRIQISEIEKSL